MALIGGATDAVWSGTGYTRGSGDWIPMWSDELLKKPRPNPGTKPEPVGFCTQDKWKNSSNF